MRVMTNDRVTHIIEVRYLHFIEQDGIFELAGVSHDDAVADDHIFAHVTAAANVAVFADPRRAFQHRALLNDGSSANKNMAAYKWLTHQLAQDDGLEAKLQVTGDLFERIPNVILIFEQLRMSRVFEVKEIGRRKHFSVVKMANHSQSCERKFWEAHAYRVPATASSRSRTSLVRLISHSKRSLKESSFRRDAETNTRDACATRTPH